MRKGTVPPGMVLSSPLSCLLQNQSSALCALHLAPAKDRSFNSSSEVLPGSPVPASQALSFLDGRGRSIIARLDGGAEGAAYRVEVKSRADGSPKREGTAGGVGVSAGQEATAR